MLRKLMKYELMATARVMLPLYLAVAALAAALRLLAVWSDSVHFYVASAIYTDIHMNDVLCVWTISSASDLLHYDLS